MKKIKSIFADAYDWTKDLFKSKVIPVTLSMVVIYAVMTSPIIVLATILLFWSFTVLFMMSLIAKEMIIERRYVNA